MRHYGDNELLNREAEEQEREEELARIRRIARTEYRRMQSGEAEQDLEEDRRLEEAEQQKAPKKLPKWVQTMRRIATGEILVGDGASQIYDRLLFIAFLFFGSIVINFLYISTEDKLNHLTKEVDLLHERVIRKREQCYNQCSHSAIVERLKERGIELFDPLEPTSIIKE